MKKFIIPFSSLDARFICRLPWRGDCPISRCANGVELACSSRDWAELSAVRDSKTTLLFFFKDKF
jgi:hypothetical protein